MKLLVLRCRCAGATNPAKCMQITHDLWQDTCCYGVATVSRIDKIIGLFCRICLFYRSLLQKRPIILSILLTKATLYDWHSIMTRNGIKGLDKLMFETGQMLTVTASPFCRLLLRAIGGKNRIFGRSGLTWKAWYTQGLTDLIGVVPSEAS